MINHPFLRPTLLALLLLAGFRAQEKPSGFSPEKLARIPELLQKAVDRKQIAGASTLIARQGKVVHTSYVGFQDVEARAPLTESTIFRIASMSKPITSAAAMILVDDGKLAVTDPL